MNNEKNDLGSIKDVLSRDEMKSIVAGSGGCGGQWHACIEGNTYYYWCTCEGNCIFLNMQPGCWA